MLEKDFNELDNDFITLWSMFFRQEKIKFEGKLAEYIEYLAEMGQVNALQSYYLYNVKGKNKNVDLVANHYIKTKQGFNIDLLVAHKSCCLTKELANKIEDMVDESERYFRCRYDVSLTTADKLLREDLRFSRFPKLDYYKYTISAIERAKTEWVKNGDVLAGERMIEMMAGLKAAWPFKEDKSKFNQLFKYAGQIRKLLWAEFASHNWSVDKLIENSPATAYALGKSLTSSSLRKWYEVDSKKRKIGKEIIEKLSSRTLSKVLMDYTEARNTEKEEEKRLRNRAFVDNFLATEATPEKLAQRAREMDCIVDFGNSDYSLDDEPHYLGGDYGYDEIDKQLDAMTARLSKKLAGPNNQESAVSYTPEQLGLYDSRSENSGGSDEERISDAVKHIKLVNDMTKDI